MLKKEQLEIMFKLLLLLQIHSHISSAESTDNTRGYFASCVVFENNDWNKIHVLLVKPWNKEYALALYL